MATAESNKRRSEELDAAVSDTAAPPLRLLVHAVDGVVPYLTPTLLHECFPPSSSSSSMWIGIAVRDTCVHPIHKDGDDPLTSNPRGYTFSSPQFEVDRWIEPYVRFAVPSFDLIQDLDEKSGETTAEKGNRTTTTTTCQSTDHNVMLWTPHGRQSITPDMYYHACQNSLKSLHAVSLFDMAPRINKINDDDDDDGNRSQMPRRLEKNIQKQQTAATQRTRTWWKSFRTMFESNDQSSSTLSKPQLWIPVTLHDKVSEDELTTEIQEGVGDGTVAGVALIGWNYLSTHRRAPMLNAVTSTKYPIAVLSTRSLREVLELCVEQGVAVIGSNLPQTWALQKRAFLVDIPGERYDNRKRTRREQDQAHGKDDMSAVLDQDGCLPLDCRQENDDVSLHPWYRDKSPLVSGCQCLTCLIHSRAYVYHLVCAKEMLGEMLLFIHNLHHLLQLINRFRIARHHKVEHDLLQEIMSQMLDERKGSV
ncbi:hypothetical protein ACA910_011247 [Epithemia clementina (nom. ined.)]